MNNGHKMDQGAPGNQGAWPVSGPLTAAQLLTTPVQVSPVNRDAFGRQSVSSPVTLFDSKLLIDNAPLYWDDAVISGAGTSSTYNANGSSVTLAVSNLTAGFRARQTFQRFGYQPGKGQLVTATGVLGIPAAGITRRLGYFSTSDGVFFQSGPAGVAVVVRTATSGAPVNNAVLQENWNIDKMDGTGASGITLDFSKTQIFLMMFQWLGVGSVWYGFNIGGTTYWCHKQDHANTLATVYMRSPNLPMRYDIENDGTGDAASLTQICSAVVSDGGAQENGLTRSIYRTSLFAAANNTSWYPLIAIRLRSAAGLNRSIVKLKKVSITCATTAVFLWRIVLNPTVVGTALSFSPLANSAIELDVSSTNATTITGGTDLDAGVLQQTNQGNEIALSASNIRLGFSIAGTADILVLAVSRITGGAENYAAAMTLLEEV